MLTFKKRSKATSIISLNLKIEFKVTRNRNQKNFKKSLIIIRKVK